MYKVEVVYPASGTSSSSSSSEPEPACLPPLRGRAEEEEEEEGLLREGPARLEAAAAEAEVVRLRFFWKNASGMIAIEIVWWKRMGEEEEKLSSNGKISQEASPESPFFPAVLPLFSFVDG